MEEDTIHDYPDDPQPELQLDPHAIGALSSASKWAKFLAIFSFVMMGLMVVIGFSFGAIVSAITPEEVPMPFSPLLFGFIYLGLAIIYFFPILFLFQFASRVANGVRSKKSHELTKGLVKLNAHFRYVSILVIVFMGLYILTFVIISAIGFPGIGMTN